MGDHELSTKVLTHVLLYNVTFPPGLHLCLTLFSTEDNNSHVDGIIDSSCMLMIIYVIRYIYDLSVLHACCLAATSNVI